MLCVNKVLHYRNETFINAHIRHIFGRFILLRYFFEKKGLNPFLSSKYCCRFGFILDAKCISTIFLEHPKLVLPKYFFVLQLPGTEFLVLLLKVHSVYECGSQVFIATLVEVYPFNLNCL